MLGNGAICVCGGSIDADAYHKLSLGAAVVVFIILGAIEKVALSLFLTSRPPSDTLTLLVVVIVFIITLNSGGGAFTCSFFHEILLCTAWTLFCVPSCSSSQGESRRQQIMVFLVLCHWPTSLLLRWRRPTWWWWWSLHYKSFNFLLTHHRSIHNQLYFIYHNVLLCNVLNQLYTILWLHTLSLVFIPNHLVKWILGIFIIIAIITIMRSCGHSFTSPLIRLLYQL